MEGLADHFLRHLIAHTGNYDLVVTEFIRVVDRLLPESVFYRTVPELHNGAITGRNTPVRVQLLGSQPVPLADNAARAVELGSNGIDLNFGCPSHTVNKSRGGAILLNEPETLYSITQAVRKAVPENKPVSTKMRLGFEDTSLMIDCAKALESGGADELVVHARTKVQGYRAPAHWHLVAEIRDQVSIPIVINGEIWTPDDAGNALRKSKCEHLMLGRGAVRNPWLASEIKESSRNTTLWPELMVLIETFWEAITENMTHRYCSGRLKQWLKFMKDNYPEASALYQELRPVTDVQHIGKILSAHKQTAEIKQGILNRI